MALLKLENVTKVYRKGTPGQVTALDKVSLSVDSGESIAIIGRSGSGKSTLLHILGCIDRADEGKYFIENTDVSQIKENLLAEIRNTKIGFVLQEFGLLLNKTSFENIAVPLYFNKKIKNKEIPQKVSKVLDLVGLSDKENSFAGELSGGQKQRVAIARALVNNPEIILADEPTGALDSNTSAEIIELLLQLNKNGKTVIIVTHDQSVAEKCGRILKITDGKIAYN